MYKFKLDNYEKLGLIILLIINILVFRLVRERLDDDFDVQNPLQIKIGSDFDKKSDIGKAADYAKEKDNTLTLDKGYSKNCYKSYETASPYKRGTSDYVVNIRTRYNKRLKEYNEVFNCFESFKNEIQRKKTNGTASDDEILLYGRHASYLMKESHQLQIIRSKIIILEQVNYERNKRGLNVLEYSDTLDHAAQIRAEELALSYSHTRPDRRASSTAVYEAGGNQYRLRAIGENIDAGKFNGKKSMERWMNSKGHRENILREKIKEIGVGVHNENGTWYYTQILTE
jgi:hypothetical protein